MSRRRLLTYGGLALLAGAAWYVLGGDDQPPADTRTPSTPGGVRALVDRYAPDLHFGRGERWFPTDPREYADDRGGRTVVHGPEALAAYTDEFEASGTPPAPTVAYNVAPAAEGVLALQYWTYYVFDQFAVNFHWHDWELLQVFVDLEAGVPLLLSASAHSRAVPNNEFLEPDLGGRRPGILAEVGSHSSATDVNELGRSFERFGDAGRDADVTNDLTAIVEGLTSPFAYGLPRDEDARLPYAMPELDGVPLYDHPDLPGVDREDFVEEAVTVRTWRELARPPTDLPLRRPGLVMTHPDSPTTGDVSYELVPMDAVSGEIEGFTGPQLSFEFAVPGYAEDHYADHITTAGTPWKQDRFDAPLADVTDPAHRRAVDGAEPDGLTARVVGRVRRLAAGAGGDLDRVTDEERDALGDRIPVSLHPLPVEVACRLASPDPVATVTSGGVFEFLRVGPGEHTLVINGPGVAPYAERFVHDGGTVRTGADGRAAVVANEDAAWIRGDGRGADGIDRLRIVEDFVGPVYAGRPPEDDRFAVAVHRDGRYTVEITDREGRPGAFRAVPRGEDEVVRSTVRSGKASLAAALADRLDDLAELAAALAQRDGGGGGVVEELEAAADAARQAAGAARQGAGSEANELLSEVRSRLGDAIERLEGAERGGYSEASASLLARRARDADDRALLAIRTEPVA